MTREKLKQYISLKREIASLDRAIDKLRDRASEVPEVIGKVTGSSHDFPYIEEHISVRMDDPKEADMISRRIRIKNRRKEEAYKAAIEIEQFIAGIQDSTDRQIFEMIYLEGKKQREVAEAVGYSRSRVAQKIGEYLKD
ncbi:MAG: sigma-70 family RNA polymerase sigma factor [Blautia sp.]|nr:sigma-70 family RNA polymerase sigma factor [Blautia sp.]